MVKGIERIKREAAGFKAREARLPPASVLARKREDGASRAKSSRLANRRDRDDEEDIEAKAYAVGILLANRLCFKFPILKPNPQNRDIFRIATEILNE